NGCDSVITLTLAEHTGYNDTITAAICEGSDYIFDGDVITTAGIYTHVFTTVDECGSIRVLNLSVNTVFAETIAASFCPGGSYSFGGTIITEAGIYHDTLTTINGCDSIITLTLAEHTGYNDTITAAICEGSDYIFDGDVITTAGIYTHVFTTVDECDSIRVLNLSVNPVFAETIAASICPGGSYSFGGTMITESGIYHDTLTTINGCDSIITLMLAEHTGYND